MKKITATVLLSSLSVFGFAQEVKIGVEGGATYGTMRQYVNAMERTTTGQIGYKAGFNFDIALSLSGKITLQPGIFFNGNVGSESSYYSQSSTGSGIPVYEKDYRKYKINQLQIPLFFIYKFGDIEYTRGNVFLGIGPVFCLNVGGRYKQTYTNAMNGDERVREYDRPIILGGGYGKDVNAYNVNLVGTLGYEFPFGLYLRGHAGLGLVNMHPMASTRNYFTNMEAGLSVGFYFKRFNSYNNY